MRCTGLAASNAHAALYDEELCPWEPPPPTPSRTLSPKLPLGVDEVLPVVEQYPEVGVIGAQGFE